MGKKISETQLMIPVYINEKIVLDMLAVIEDGFSRVSQVSSVVQMEKSASQNGNIDVMGSVFSKLLKIDIKGDMTHSKNIEENQNISQEKVHTNVSLLSKFRMKLEEEGLLDQGNDVSNVKVGSFIELEGELQKNPLIEYMEKIIEVFRMVEIFTSEPQLGNKKNASIQQREDKKIFGQIKEFLGELKHSGTVDFILADKKGTIVLSAQEQYLANDNISKILGGEFKVLGKVIAVCKEENECIDLLRKTTLSVLKNEMVEEMLAGFQSTDIQQFNLPQLVTRINGPAMIVIPIAIYA